MTPQSQALRSIFFASTDVKKDPGSDAPPAPLNSVGILGGGLMGGGIAYVTACKAGLPVRIKDINPQGINHALKYSWDQLEGKVRRRHLKASERDKQLALISGTTDYRGFAHRDLIIEAVFENLELKQQMVAEVEQNCAAHTIFASNTSSLPIGDIAAHATRPEQVIGLHFFSPVEKNAAGGDYSSCGYISANHRHYGKTGEKTGAKRPLSCVTKPGFTSIAS